MWSIARYDLGLSDVEFYSLTPRQFDALVKRRERDVVTTEFLFAQLTAAVVNFSTCRPKETVHPRDFMPSEFGKQTQPAKRVRMTKKVRKHVTESFRAGFALLMQRHDG